MPPNIPPLIKAARTTPEQERPPHFTRYAQENPLCGETVRRYQSIAAKAFAVTAST